MEFILKKSLMIIAYLTLILSGCGQSGRLYLPHEADHNSSNNQNP